MSVGATPGVRVVVEAPLCDLGEGPVWDPRRSELVWVDLHAGRVHRLRPGAPGRPGQVRTAEVGTPVGCLAPRRSGGWVLATEKGFVLTDADLALLDPVRAPVLAADDGLRFNDGGCDAAGRFFAGTMADDDGHGRGSLLRLDPDGGVRTVLRGLTIPNGIGWSPDGSTVYHVDSGARTVFAADYDPATGGFGARRPLYRRADGDAVPDGLALDAEGAIWVAVWDGGEVVRLAPDGHVVSRIDVGVPRPTSVAFGGAGLERLYVTSARQGLTAAQLAAHPDSGRLFVAEPPVPGLPTHGWAG